VLWDGGNNDLPFFKPDVHFVVLDPLRPGHEVRYHPGETNLRMAHVLVLNKLDAARDEDVATVLGNVAALNPKAHVIRANSALTVDRPELIKDKRVLVVEDGPTLTHGEMAIGAGWMAARRFGASEIASPRAHAVGSIKAAFEKYTQVRDVLPAVGYGDEQIADLKATIDAVECDSIVVATPINLTAIIDLGKPSARVKYDLEEIGHPTVGDVISEFLSI
jgi:predicted GTPase